MKVVILGSAMGKTEAMLKYFERHACIKPVLTIGTTPKLVSLDSYYFLNLYGDEINNDEVIRS